MKRISTYLLLAAAALAIQASHPPVTCKVYLPNAFSPNDDGINDTFKAEFGVCKPSTFEMKIFNRWGRMVYSTESIDESWDGKAKGDKLPSDLYAYYIKFSYESENSGTETEIVSGEVSLLR